MTGRGPKVVVQREVSSCRGMRWLALAGGLSGCGF